ncbi:AraC family transcriptional regulator [Hoeflea sp. CAU 1731]
MLVQPHFANHYVTKSDLTARREARDDRWLDPYLDADDRILRGAISFLTLEKGLSVHFSNAVDLHDLEIESVCERRLSVVIFLEGSVDASIGKLRIPMPEYDAPQKRWNPVATIFAQTNPERFVRKAHKGMLLRKVTISIAPEWLDKMPETQTPDLDLIKRFANSHLAYRSWSPSPHAISLAEQIISAPGGQPFLQAIYIQSRVLGLIEEAFRQVCHINEPAPNAPIRALDRTRLQAVDHFLDTHAGPGIAIGAMCQEIGMSENSLRRLVANAYGMPISQYIRRYMLERARQTLERDNVTISEAAYNAGYTSPANFATAFKRHFGMSPSSLQK